MNHHTSLVLPLLSDTHLRALKRQYETTTERGAFSEGHHGHRPFKHALEDVERELRARGIDAEPWWVVDNPQSN